MSRFRVFLGAPSREDVHGPDNASIPYKWTSFRKEDVATPISPDHDALPPATFQEATSRLADLYKGVIFAESQEDDDESVEFVSGILSPKIGKLSSQQARVPIRLKSLVEKTLTTDRSIAITDWPPTAPRADETSIGPSQQRASQYNTTTSLTDSSFNETYEDDSSSSIGRFPTFHVNPHSLTSLTSLLARDRQSSWKVTVLVGTLEVEGPEAVTIRKGKDAGKQVSLLKLIVGDEQGRIAKVTAWREVAEAWSGKTGDTGLRKGDTVHLENISPSIASNTGALSFTASPSLRSSLHICYRSLPQTKADGRLRPDLRLGMTDAGVRKVAQVVAWIERMAGIGVTAKRA